MGNGSVAVQDLWHLTTKSGKKGECGCRGGDYLPSKRHRTGKQFRVHWIDPDTNKPVSRHAETEDEAKDIQAEIRVALNTGKYQNPAKAKIQFPELARLYQEAPHRHTPATTQHIDWMLRKIVPLTPAMYVKDLRKSHFQGVVKKLEDDLAPRSVRIAHERIRAVINWGISEGYLQQNHTKGVSLPPLPDDEMFVPTRDQVHEIAAAMPLRFRVPVVTAAGTGLRGSELFALEPSSIDRQKMRIRVGQQLLRENGRVVMTPTKTGKIRYVDMSPMVDAAIERHTVEFGTLTVPLLDRVEQHNVHERDAELIFFTASNQPATRSVWGGAWTRMRRDKLSWIPTGTGWHSLRHYFATLLIVNGSSVKTVQKLLGHAKATTTLDTYVGYWPDQDAVPRAIVDDALGEWLEAA